MGDYWICPNNFGLGGRLFNHTVEKFLLVHEFKVYWEFIRTGDYTEDLIDNTWLSYKDRILVVEEGDRNYCHRKHHPGYQWVQPFDRWGHYRHPMILRPFVNKNHQRILNWPEPWCCGYSGQATDMMFKLGQYLYHRYPRAPIPLSGSDPSNLQNERLLLYHV